MNAMAVSQRSFASALLEPLADAPAGLRAASGNDARRRFAVYRNNLTVSLIDALAESFPVVRALVGAEFFAAMARERLRVDPPRSPILNDYGDGFADFIASFAPAASVRYLADMARLERLRVQAYHAADADPLPTDAWQALLAAPERLAAVRVTLHPACRWLASRFAVHALWLAHQHSDAAATVDADAAVIGTTLAALDVEAGEDVLVVRPQWDVQMIALPPGGIAWLDALRDGASLGAALSRVASQSDTRPDALLALLLQHGLVTAIDVRQEH
ncbi:MAG: DNA-binding domain-containing protein [Luteimonas sp.]